MYESLPIHEIVGAKSARIAKLCILSSDADKTVQFYHDAFSYFQKK